MKRSNLFLPLIVLFALSIFTHATQARTKFPDTFYYLSPSPGAKMVRPETGIILKTSAGFISEELITGITVEGTLSGKMHFDARVLRHENAILIRPTKNFRYDEKVTVTINRAIFCEPIAQNSMSFAFHTMKQPVNHPGTSGEFYAGKSHTNSENTVSGTFIEEFNLPADFPEYEITQKKSPAPGYFFLTPLKWENYALYVIMMDNQGFPVFYRKNPAGCYDFKLQPTGELTYFESDLQKYIRLNSKMDLIGYYAMGNGYSTDLHECNVTADGHVWMLGYDPQLVDMDTVVEGGQQGAIVTGLIVQEQDENGNVLFQWRSWDHFQITDASDWIDLTAATIDYVHGNTIDIMDENAILISCRNMNEITKIDRNTGEIIWRMGGQASDNNMFSFPNDPYQFRMQHDIRYHSDNLISLFNNSNGSDPDPWSSSIFYHLDEEKLTATQVERYYNDPPVFSDIMGNCQWLDNGNVVTGWGRPDNNIVTTEFSPNGEQQMQITIPHTVYRSFKFLWENDVFAKSTDTLDYSIYHQDSATQQVIIGNNHIREITINGFHKHTDAFELLNDTLIPVTLLPGASVAFSVKFGPAAVGEYTDVLSFYEDIENENVVQRIACQVQLKGTALDEESVYEHALSAINVSLNPGNGVFNITINKNHLPLNLQVTDVAGALVKRFKQLNRHEIIINLKGRPDGVYLLRATELGTGRSQTLKLIKATP